MDFESPGRRRHFPQNSVSIVLNEMGDTGRSPPKPQKSGESDGRALRRERTRKMIIEAFILVLRERPRVPTVAEIADRAGYAVRTLYLHFPDLPSLAVAASDHAISTGLAVPIGDKADADRATRIRFQAEVRARNCEEWLPMWRLATRYTNEVPDLARRVALARRLVLERMQIMYRRELSELDETQKRAVLLSLEALTDYESWGRLRSDHGMSFDEACAFWVAAIDRILPPTPAQTSDAKAAPAR